jgi:hypothetical protein
MVWQLVLQYTNVQPRAPWLHSGLPLPQYFLWIAAQPLLGALVTFWSQRCGGTRRIVLFASLLPSMILLGLWIAGLAYGILIEKDVHILQQPQYMILRPLMWGIFPGLAVLLGTIPFLKRSTPIES